MLGDVIASSGLRDNGGQHLLCVCPAWGGIASASMTVFTGLRDYIAATGTSAVSRLASMR